MPLLYCACYLLQYTENLPLAASLACFSIKKRRYTKQLRLVQRPFCYQKLTDYQQLHHSQSFQSLYFYFQCSQSL